MSLPEDDVYDGADNLVHGGSHGHGEEVTGLLAQRERFGRRQWKCWVVVLLDTDSRSLSFIHHRHQWYVVTEEAFWSSFRFSCYFPTLNIINSLFSDENVWLKILPICKDAIAVRISGDRSGGGRPEADVWSRAIRQVSEGVGVLCNAFPIITNNFSWSVN